MSQYTKPRKVFPRATKIIHMTPSQIGNNAFIHCRSPSSGDQWQNTVTAQNTYKYSPVCLNIISLLWTSKPLTTIRRSNIRWSCFRRHQLSSLTLRQQRHSTSEIWVKCRVQKWTFTAVILRKDIIIIENIWDH